MKRWWKEKMQKKGGNREEEVGGGLGEGRGRKDLVTKLAKH